MAFSPVVASSHIKDKYYRYLRTFFRPGEPYSKEFDELLSDTNAFAAGPYLDLTDAFKKGKSIHELIQEGILPNSFLNFSINPDRPLYLHQEKAIRKITQEKKNVVVSTGTGSGKTESFLIPVLRELAIEAENGTLCPGVRALLLYPMNALANDQTERLREVLKDYPTITFGVYTGQTKQTEREALTEYKSLNDNAEPIPNEKISRNSMIAEPPHILITNYAMLEYLMLRPKDSVFFDKDKAKYWKFIVFDEAHVYGGSTGIEVSMLFRRLKAKLGNRDIRYILTSATLGDKDDDDKVAEFASSLCSAVFDAKDIVRADRIIPATEHGQKTLPTSFYNSVATLKNNDRPETEIASAAGIPMTADLANALYDIIVHDENYWKLRRILERPQTVFDAAKQMGWTTSELTDFVTVASSAEKDGGKLFDARYHMFLRAADSAFITLAPDAHIMLDRQKYHTDVSSGQNYKVFEIAVCSFCNAIYLVGKIENNCLEQFSAISDDHVKEMFLLGDDISDTDDDHTLETEGIKTEPYRICPYCGYLKEEGTAGCCEHGETELIKIFRVKLTGESQTLTKCPRCENTRSTGVLRMFFSGQEAATSVIGTALFEELPAYKISIETKEPEQDDEFGDFSEENSDIPNKEATAKQFIAFSDSRQAAAFYASYLNISYNSILNKRLIIEALKQQNRLYSVPSFAERLQTFFENYNILGKSALTNDVHYAMQKEAWKAVFAELTDNNGTTSLTQFGLIGIDLDLQGKNYKKYNIDSKEFRSLCSVFAMSMLSDAAFSYDPIQCGLTEIDKEDFTHNGVMYSYTLSDSTGKHRRSFLPTRAGKTNKRVDYVQRVLNKKGFPLTEDEAAEFLEKIWEKILVAGKYLSVQNGAYRIDSSKIVIYRPEQVYICKKCRKITCHNIENVCPAYHCDGELVPFDPSEDFKDNHYYRIYNDLDIRDLRVVEHTAQLDRDSAYEYQKEFKQKKIDVLSCSTTFEMGVDVGSLETVFMRNMPPMPSNYAQRAGRAGRSKLSAAFALTFCNKGSHDFSFFRDPTEMIKGKIAPPKYTVENDRIAIRHLYAAAFSFFWKLHPDLFTDIGSFLKKDERGLTGLDVLKSYLLSKPAALKQYLFDFLPGELAQQFNVENFGWVDGLIGDNGVLTNAIETYSYEVQTLEDLKNQLFAENKFVGSIQQRLKAYETERILTFFSRKNVLPKYGFPVDTVEMTVSSSKDGQQYGLQLQRDLSMAISEYAPGSQIVANNNLITSRYIKKIPSIGWKMYSYIKCARCNTLNIKTYTEETQITQCCQCGEVFTKNPKIFLIPDQGFTADGNNIRRPGLKKPERTYRGEISYVGFRNDVDEQHYNIGNAEVIVSSSHNDEMAVLNESNFFVCEQCGYAEIDDDTYVSKKPKKHNRPNGYPCSCKDLRRYSLGYRFLTDVVRIKFEDHDIENFEQGLSILHGLLRGICRYLNIEENDISGCLQSYFAHGKICYSIVIFDNTPGGAGHAKRLNDPQALEGSMRTTLRLMRGCVCGGAEGDSSCYSCLRNYKNQKYHDILKRKHVIDFLSEILN